MIDQLKTQYTNFEGFYSRYFNDYKPIKNNEWKVKCPFHDDKTPSMTVNIKTGMFNCFGCNAQGDFIKFYMNINNKPFKIALKELCQEVGITEAKKVNYEIKETYDYVDAKSNLISQTVRFEPKKFSQRAKVNGQWVWSLKGVNPVLYNLPEVSQAKRVILLEGEKDCDNAKAIGCTATTCPMGAGKWKDSYTKNLIGKEIILCPDNDPVGIEHMLKIGRELKGNANVRWLSLPNKNQKGFDFSDYIFSFENEVKAKEAVDALIRGARAFDESKIIIPEPDSKESEEIKAWIKASPGEFSTRDLDYDLGFKDPAQKQKRTKILEKFVAETVISREGKRRGVYRPYKSNLELMDYKNGKDSYLPIWLPMGIHQMVGIMEGNVIVFAGDSNAGKTAMMLNIIKANMRKFNVHYFNSEMGGGELKNRLSKFSEITEDDWKFNAYSRDSDFADVMFTGSRNINIIDFLEIHDDFYLVGEKIKQIHSALKGAIAIIAIQKNKGSEMAVGGNRTMEKARLVVNVEPGRFKITKAKNFINPELNPNGMMCDWKLVQGCNFVMISTDWYKN